jgi:aminoacyl-tRNA hydrolase
VLNADDPRVLAMQSRCAGRVITYGLAPTAMLRAEDIHSRWPDRLSFTALHEGHAVKVTTRLCGTHWVPSVLAAMAVGQAMGVPLEAAAEAIADVPPVTGRMCPVTTPDGVTFIRDDCKAPLWTIPASLEFMCQATAKRKIVVVGTISDYPGNPAQKYPRVARQALEVADLVIFVSHQASMGLRAKRQTNDQALKAFATADQLLGFLRGFLQPGDLVLLKGSEKAENLGQIVSAWISGRTDSCTSNRIGLPNESPSNRVSLPKRGTNVLEFSAEQIIVGLGNPGQKFHDTPHNVGQQAIDRLARLLRATWSRESDAVVARVRTHGQRLLLIKPQALMNDTGPLLMRMAEQLGFGPEDCVIIQDDINLAMGVVRQRMNGSAGGHNGVQSIIVAFQSEAFRRVKIGVGRPASAEDLVEYVLTPFNAAQRETIDQACREAAGRVLKMVGSTVESL